MHTPALPWIRRGLWAILALFFVASGAAAYTIHAELQPSTGVTCGNCLTDPVRMILNLGAPLVAVTVSGLAYLTHRAGGRLWPVVSVGTLSAAIIAGFVVFGMWLFRDLLPGYHLSEIVWWMF
jgi:hypothetical protein